MKKVIIYDEYSIESNSIAWFWNFMVRCDDDMKKKFIFFTTGNARAPHTRPHCQRAHAHSANAHAHTVPTRTHTHC